MPDLTFTPDGVEAVPFAAAPLLAIKLRITEPAGIPIHAVALRCQIRIEPARRRYTAEEQRRLSDLFGPPSDWSRTLRPMLWTHTGMVLNSFTGSTVVDLPIPCTADFNAAAGRYFCGLDEDAVPLCLLFSGTVFYEAGSLQATPISWDKEAYLRLPVRVWREMMDHYFPSGAFLCVQRDLLDRLGEYRRHHGLATWDQALGSLFESAEERARR